MKQVTLAMLYGPKPACLSAVIAECQKQIASLLGNCFQPYDLLQVHATLVSLTQIPGSKGSNLYLSTYRGQSQCMDLLGLLNFIRTSGHFPLRVRLGGFQDRDYPFCSQGQRPYSRSFSIVGNEIVVARMIGWPICEAETSVSPLAQEKYMYPATLEEVRRAAEGFNILHRYYFRLTDIDNDFYFRIGLIHQLDPDSPVCRQAEHAVREFLSTIKPVVVEIALADVYVASFQDETLPLASTRVWSVNDDRVTPEIHLEFVLIPSGITACHLVSFIKDKTETHTEVPVISVKQSKS